MNMNDLTFEAGKFYKFHNELSKMVFMEFTDAFGDEEFAAFVGIEPFEVTGISGPNVYCVKNSKGIELHASELDQAYIISDDEIHYFVPVESDEIPIPTAAEIVYERCIKALTIILGEEGINILNKVDALQYINQAAHQLFPTEPEE